MEQKIDQIINNQTVMLREMTSMRKDLNKVTNDVEELKGKVTSLEKGQESLNKKVDFILDDNKSTKDTLLWITKDYIHTKDRIETRLERIETKIA